MKQLGAAVFTLAILMSSGPFAEEIRPGVFRTPNGRFENLPDYPEGYAAALLAWLEDTKDHSARSARTKSTLTAADIPVAHTPEGYWDEMPTPILAECGEPLVKGAIDMRGTWKVVECTMNGKPNDRMIGVVQRIEQCGNRVVICGGGVTHDMRCDGTYENGVDDIGEPSSGGRPISVAASFEDGVHVLRPKGVPITVEHEIVDGELIWRYGPFTLRAKRVESD